MSPPRGWMVRGWVVWLACFAPIAAIPQEPDEVAQQIQEAFARLGDPTRTAAERATERARILAAVEELVDRSSGEELDRSTLRLVPWAWLQLALSSGLNDPSGQEAPVRALFEDARDFIDEHGLDELRELLFDTAVTTALAANDAERVRELCQEVVRDPSTPLFLVPHALAQQADSLRMSSRWQDALDLLDRAQTAYQALSRSPADGNRARLRGTQALIHGVRGQTLENGFGLLGLAARCFSREREDLDELIALLTPLRDRAEGEGREQLDVSLQQLRIGLALSDLRVADLYLDLERYPEVLSTCEEILTSQSDARARATASLLRTLALLYQLEAEEVERSVLDRALRECRAQPLLTPLEHLRLDLVELEVAVLEGDTKRGRILAERLESSSAFDDPVSVQSSRLAELRARIALDAGSREERLDRLDRLNQSMDELLRQWSSTPCLPGGVNFLHGRWRQDLVATQTALLHRLGRDDEILQWSLRFQAMGTMARLHDLPAVEAAETPEKTRQRLVSTLVPAGGGILQFVPGWTQCFVIALDAEHLVIEPLPGLPRIRASVRAVASETLAPPVGSRKDWEGVLRARCRRLTEDLVPASLRAMLSNWREWIIVGADLLERPRFECLLLEPSAEFLGLRTPITYLPSLPVGLWLAQKATTPRTAAAGVGELTLVVGPIPERQGGLAREVATLVALRNSPLVLQGSDATLERLATSSSSSSRVLHFLCHGDRDEELAQPAGLRLFGETLWCEQIAQIPRAEVVILSACGAARGRERLGEDGLADLGGAFLQHGAFGVVLADHKVELQSTVQLSARLQQELFLGRATAEALFVARRSIAAEEPWQHPFYWATLQFLGLATWSAESR